MKIVGYHGSHRYSRQPSPSRMGDFGPGIYFASRPEDAKNYGPHVYQADLILQNPLNVGVFSPAMKRIMSALHIGDDDLTGEGPPWHEIVGLAITLIDVGYLSIPKFTAFIRKLGFDSIYVPNDVIVATGSTRTKGDYVIVFDQSQISNWTRLE